MNGLSGGRVRFRGSAGGLHELGDDDWLNGDSGRISLHSPEDDDRHLDEGCFSGGLINCVPASQVDTITSPDDLKQRVSMDPKGNGSDGS